MTDLLKKITKHQLYLGLLLLAFSLNSCSDDDDGLLEDDNFTGTITAMDQIVSGDIIMVQNVTVTQDSWLAAVHSDEISSDNFIAGPLFIDEGVHTDLSLLLHDDANLEPNGDEIVLKLYAEDDDGIFGEWDIDDEPITDDDDLLVTQTITVIMEGSFSSFDEDNDGMLDENEVPNTYQNNFDVWDVDDDGFLTADEFYTTTFYITDADDDDFIDEDEWLIGYDSMYSAYIDDDFAAYDVDGDGFIEETEWFDTFADSQWFEIYDVDDDSLVAYTEWDEGLFNDWDLDDDDFIDEDEFINYIDYVTFW
ncbi:DUF7282 domain-containing protein [Salinimicrobium terrae]|uniref:DUF7282 domain-containing protein n=1 Tax=Salinimicrobium terrae TaxID=470866 RepID=UPI0003FE1696|nr:hypothetical protein [Salinimicrobium terrae]